MLKKEVYNLGKDKKGISPLIATVLLIGFTIVLAALVFRWGSVLFKETTGPIGCEAGGTITCSSNIGINVGNIVMQDRAESVPGNGDQVHQITSLIVSNMVSSRKITGFKVQVELDTGEIETQDASSTMTIDPGQSRDIAAGGIDFYSSRIAQIRNNIAKITVIPTFVQTTNEGETCTIICEQQKQTTIKGSATLSFTL